MHVNVCLSSEIQNVCSKGLSTIRMSYAIWDSVPTFHCVRYL